VRKTWLTLAALCVGIAIIGGCASSGGAGPATEARSAAPDPTPEPAPREFPDEPPVNTLRWTTASEVDNFGFDIYRGLSEDGPFERINAEPLPGAGTIDEPQNYVFIDETIDPSRDYFYYIESISLGGIRERFSPIIRSPAKRPVPDTD